MTQDEKNQEKEAAKQFEAFIKALTEELLKDSERMRREIKEMEKFQACTQVMKGQNFKTLVHLN